MKAGEPLTVREASFISLLMGHTERTGAATVRFTMHVDGSLDGQINIRWVTCARLRSICTHWHLSRALVVIGITRLSPSVDQTGQNASWQALHGDELRTAVVVHLRAKNPDFDLRVAAGHKRGTSSSTAADEECSR